MKVNHQQYEYLYPALRLKSGDFFGTFGSATSIIKGNYKNENWNFICGSDGLIPYNLEKVICVLLVFFTTK